MNLQYLVVAGLCASALVQTAFAGGKTSKCSPPTGTITISPDQQCQGKSTIAIGKEILLTATSLYDKDCYCGNAVQDSISRVDGVKWSVGGGSYGGRFVVDDTGTPNSWIASYDPHTDLAVRLKVTDEATAEHTTKDVPDGTFLEVDSKNLDVVIPNSGTNTGSGYTSPCNGKPHGRSRTWTITASRSGCTVDFSELYINESGCSFVDNGCGFPDINDGSNKLVGDQQLDSNNTAADADETAICFTSNWMDANGPCTTTSTCDWSIKANGGSYHDWSRWNYSVTVPNPGGIDNLTYDRSWNSAL